MPKTFVSNGCRPRNSCRPWSSSGEGLRATEEAADEPFPREGSRRRSSPPPATQVGQQRSQDWKSNAALPASQPRLHPARRTVRQAPPFECCQHVRDAERHRESELHNQTLNVLRCGSELLPSELCKMEKNEHLVSSAKALNARHNELVRVFLCRTSLVLVGAVLVLFSNRAPRRSRRVNTGESVVIFTL